MEHKKYKNLIDEYFFGEINFREKTELEEHLKNCELCRSEFYSAKVLRESLLKNELPEPEENLLKEARNDLRASLRKESVRENFWDRISGRLNSSFFLTPQLAAAAFSFLIIGIVAGYFVFKTTGTIHYIMENPMQDQVNQENILAGDTRISNIRFMEKNPVDGTVEFTFDAVKPVHIKGKISDPEIQNVLTYSMLNEENPGTRLNTINLINASVQPQPDNEIKNALLSVVKFDNNQGVRWEAIKLIKKFRFDDQIKNAMLYVLQNDSSSGMRIEAMNILVQANKKGNTFNKEDLSVFRKKMQQDDNNFIRYQAKTVLKENN
jgi:hypothetical protein